MNEFTTDIIAALANKQNLDELFRSYLEDAINYLLKTELTAFLGYERYESTGINSGNNRNGSYERTITTKYGTLHLDIPRDRNGVFANHTIPAYDRRTDPLEDMVIHTYSKGLSTSEIADLLEKMYGSYYSPATVSNITKGITEHASQFRTGQLNNKYVAIYLDATYMVLRRDTVSREAVHIAIGIRPDGTKEVLNYIVAPTESTTIWTELLGQLVAQGVSEVLVFIADGLVGLDEGLDRFFPNSKRQRCLVHVGKNLMAKVRPKDSKPVIDDFKQINRAINLGEAQTRLAEFITKWQSKYKRACDQLAETPNLLTFFSFPSAIRGSLYSTNLIESFNKHLKRMTKHKEQFPNEDSLDRLLVTQFNEYDNKFSSRCHKGFKQCADTLESMFV